MLVRMKPSLLAASLSAATLLAGCASTPPPPTFNPADAATAQAATFIGANKQAKYMADVKKVALTGCNVMFADRSSASASTGAGLFGDRTSSSTRRVDEKVVVIYTMVGLDDAVMQKMTDDICIADGGAMSEDGLSVVTRSGLEKNEQY